MVEDQGGSPKGGRLRVLKHPWPVSVFHKFGRKIYRQVLRNNYQTMPRARDTILVK